MKPAQMFRFVPVLLVTASLTVSVWKVTQGVSHTRTIPQPPITEQPKPDPAKVAANIPLTFEPNRGQSDSRAKFIARPSGHGLFISATEAWLTLSNAENDSQTIRMQIVGGDSKADISGKRELSSKSNYLIGEQRNWIRGLPNYGQVQVEDVYPGIDVLYYGTDQRRLEYDFVVAPTANYQLISLKFDGVDKRWIDESGALHLKTRSGDVVQPAPVIYQEIAGQRVIREGRYELKDELVKFEIGEFDHDKPLVIDPQLLYASYHGGTGNDLGKGVAVDLNGNAYVVGVTDSSDLVLKNPWQGSRAGSQDMFVIKVNSTGTELLYSTYIGSKKLDDARGIAVTSDGRACIVGTVDNTGNSSDYPLTANRFQGNGNSLGNREADGVITLFNTKGDDLEYSTFFAGKERDEVNSVAFDVANKIYVTGDTISGDLPTKHAFQSLNNGSAAFIAKFDPEKEGNDSLIYSSFHGGRAGFERGQSIAVTSVGVAFFTGSTSSDNFPTRSASSLPPFQTSHGGGLTDGYVAKVSPDGDLIYSTYFGGSGEDTPLDIAVDNNERAYITGTTDSSAATFPLKNAFDDTRNGSRDAFISKFNADGTTLFYSSFITGCARANEARGIALDGGESAFITGFATCERDEFPQIDGFPLTVAPGPGFLVRVGPSDATGSIPPTVLFSDNFLGGATGIALDKRSSIYITGGLSKDHSINIATPGSFQNFFAGGDNDAILYKFSSPVVDTIGTFRSSQFLLRNSNTSGSPDLIVEFGQKGDLPVAGDWNGDGLSDVGVFRPTTGQFLLRVPGANNSVTVVTIKFGVKGDLPVAGDWNGDGIDTPGIFRPGTVGSFQLTNSIQDGSSPAADISFNFGVSGDRPLAGDWNGDLIDTVGIYRINAGIGEFHLTNDFENSTDIFFNFGVTGDLPIAGDWTGKGFDTPGVFRPSKSTMFLANNFVNVADIFFVFGQSGDLPVAGDWDGK